MRGLDRRSGALFSHVDLEELAPASHPLRTIRDVANEALGSMSATFEAVYAPIGRPPLPPEIQQPAKAVQAAFAPYDAGASVEEAQDRNAVYEIE
jgi:hypothetical protein